MADLPFFSSQASQYEQHQILPDQENVDSSPLKGRGQDTANLDKNKAKGLPTVTPKRFRKFFTPRASLSSRAGRQSKAGRQLRDITKNGANRRPHLRPLELAAVSADDNDENPLLRPNKRRKVSVDFYSSPPRSSPLQLVSHVEPPKMLNLAPRSPLLTDDEDLSDLMSDFAPFPKAIRRLRQTGSGRRVLERSFGGYDTLTRGRRGTDHCADQSAETANFCSTPDDSHHFATRDTLPFCTASCHTNSIVAIGEEEGSLRLIDSSASSDFSKTHVKFRPHHNAIMDLAFSSDDYLLATASGDQTSRIVDMHTQQTICILSGHRSSVKQIKFHQHDRNVLTTSARDGSVQIWDMRCGGIGTVNSLLTSSARNVDNGGREPRVYFSRYSMGVGTAFRAPNVPLTHQPVDSGLSVTAIQHLPDDRSHLLLTTSEANATVKLWDLRNASRRTQAVPLSSIEAPASHSKTRSYAINALVLSTDGSRFYTLCRDNTVYAYATNSLVLGHAPEMTSSAGKGRLLKEPKTGLGPLYGFRHPKLMLGSFYIKASMRQARGDNTEMLAVGSSEHCPILFTTDERHLPSRRLQDTHDTAIQRDDDDEDDSELPSSTPTNVKADSTVPIYNHGTALIRGHRKEVTATTWAHDGDLVSIADDSIARCWREDAEKARWLRGCGEGGGKRWNHGWAEAEEGFDEDDEEV